MKQRLCTWLLLLGGLLWPGFRSADKPSAPLNINGGFKVSNHSPYTVYILGGGRVRKDRSGLLNEQVRETPGARPVRAELRPGEQFRPTYRMYSEAGASVYVFGGEICDLTSGKVRCEVEIYDVDALDLPPGISYQDLPGNLYTSHEGIEVMLHSPLEDGLLQKLGADPNTRAAGIGEVRISQQEQQPLRIGPAGISHNPRISF